MNARIIFHSPNHWHIYGSRGFLENPSGEEDSNCLFCKKWVVDYEIDKKGSPTWLFCSFEHTVKYLIKNKLINPDVLDDLVAFQVKGEKLEDLGEIPIEINVGGKYGSVVKEC